MGKINGLLFPDAQAYYLESFYQPLELLKVRIAHFQKLIDNRQIAAWAIASEVAQSTAILGHASLAGARLTQHANTDYLTRDVDAARRFQSLEHKEAPGPDFPVSVLV